MSSIRTAEQAKAESIAVMGQSLGELYEALWQEVAWLNSKWAQYVELFGTKPSRIDLLNQAAPSFFGYIQDALWEDIILHISRLTDSPVTGRKPNLSIKRIPEQIEDLAFCQEIEFLIKSTVDNAAFCKDWRNRHIAHRDLHRALTEDAHPLEFASRAKVKDVLKGLSDVFNAISLHYFDVQLSFESTEGSGDVMPLLNIINDGLKFDINRRKEIENGTYNPANYPLYDL